MGRVRRGASLGSRGFDVPAAVREAQVILETKNPITLLPRDAFIQLLTLIVESEKFAHGRPRTKTGITLAIGLDVLTGRSPPEAFDTCANSPFAIDGLSQLGGGATNAFCYLRVVAEVAALRSKPVP